MGGESEKYSKQAQRRKQFHTNSVYKECISQEGLV